MKHFPVHTKTSPIRNTQVEIACVHLREMLDEMLQNCNKETKGYYLDCKKSL